MTIRIVTHEFEINTTPLEKIIFDSNSGEELTVELDDINKKRIVLSFEPILGLSITDDDFLYYASIEYEGAFPRKLMEITPPEWYAYSSVTKSQIIKRTKALSFQLRHFILPCGDKVIEILANRYQILS